LVPNTECGRKKSPIWEANKFKTKEDTANVFFLFLESTQNVVLTLCRSYLKPYCMGRKTVFFSGHLIYILKQERFRAFRPAGGFKSRALWSVRAGKRLNQ
jgi:CDGSH-type Zn-finger protein